MLTSVDRGRDFRLAVCNSHSCFTLVSGFPLALVRQMRPIDGGISVQKPEAGEIVTVRTVKTANE